jgi:hypothetical protein
MKNIKIINYFFIICTLFCKMGYSQKVNKISFGLNITHFNDWKNRPLNFFNPEISFSKAISKNQYIHMNLNGFYNKASSKDLNTTGSVFQRLIFTYDLGFEQAVDNFSVSIGPSVRFRNEKKVVYLPQTNPFDFLIDPNKSHFDFGAFTNVKYGIPFNKKSFFDVRLTYRIYNKGVNPFSIGLFYGRHL